MNESVAHILEEVEHLSAVERAELADRIVEALDRDIPPENRQAQVNEVRRRIAEVESGKVTLIPGDQAIAEVRRIVESARRGN